MRFRKESDVGFTRDDKARSYALKYELRGGTYSVRYALDEDNTVTFVFTDDRGRERTENYRRRARP